MDLNITVAIVDQVVLEFVKTVSDRIARSLSQKLTAFVDVAVSGGAGNYQAIFTMEYGDKQVATIGFLPGTNVIPVNQSMAFQTRIETRHPGVDVEFISNKLKEFVAELLPRFAARMIRAELR